VADILECAGSTELIAPVCSRSGMPTKPLESSARVHNSMLIIVYAYIVFMALVVPSIPLFQSILLGFSNLGRSRY
jgi:hypothetical protein